MHIFSRLKLSKRNVKSFFNPMNFLVGDGFVTPWWGSEGGKCLGESLDYKIAVNHNEVLEFARQESFFFAATTAGMKQQTILDRRIIINNLGTATPLMGRA